MNVLPLNREQFKALLKSSWQLVENKIGDLLYKFMGTGRKRK